MVEKVVGAEVKASLQLPSGTREINSRYPKRYKPLIKKDKNNAYWEHCKEVFNKDKNKTKSHNSFSAKQPQTQAPKKDKHSCQGDHPATKINALKVAKKDKNKAKDLSHVKYYTYKQKSHYANKYPKKPKN